MSKDARQILYFGITCIVSYDLKEVLLKMDNIWMIY